MSIMGGDLSELVIFMYIFFSPGHLFKVNGDLRKNNIELACRYPNAALLAYY